MLKYTGKYWAVLAPLLKKSLKRHYGKAFAVRTMRAAKPCYRDMLNRMDDIGADNPMATNVYMSFVFLSAWKVADGAITVDALREISREVIAFPPLKCMGLFMNMNKPSGVRAIRNMMQKNADWLERHPQYKPCTWDFNFDAERHRDGFYYHFTKCPLNNFARREGMLDVLHVMCEMDHLTAKLMHAKLYRAQTLARGGAFCDYWYVGDKNEHPE